MPGGYKNINGKDGVKFTADNKVAEKWTETDALRLGNNLIAWLMEADENIFFDEFIHLVAKEEDYTGKLYADILSYLSDKYSSFLELHKKAQLIEKTKLKKFGAFDKLNASIVKFVLSADYGMTEKTKTDITLNDIKKSKADLFPTIDEMQDE